MPFIFLIEICYFHKIMKLFTYLLFIIFKGNRKRAYSNLCSVQVKIIVMLLTDLIRLD